jgi:hypothetical protein
MAEISLQGRYEEVPKTLFLERIRPHASGNPAANAAQGYALVHPDTASRYSWTRLKLLWEYLQAIRHAQLTAIEKGRCYAVVVRYLFQAGKWKRVLRGDFAGGIPAGKGGNSPKTSDGTPQNAEAATTECEPVSTG